MARGTGDVGMITVSDDKLEHSMDERTPLVGSPRRRWENSKDIFEGHRDSLGFFADTDIETELAIDMESSSSEKAYPRFLLEPGVGRIRLILHRGGERNRSISNSSLRRRTKEHSAGRGAGHDVRRELRLTEGLSWTLEQYVRG